jgi:hypothetical protein
MFVRSIVLTAGMLAVSMTSARLAAQAAPAKLDFPVGEAPQGQAPTGATTGSAPAPSTSPAPSVPSDASGASVAQPAALAAGAASAANPAAPAAVSDIPAANAAQPPSTLDTGSSTHHDLSDDPLFLPGALSIAGGSALLLASLFTGLSAHASYTSLEQQCRNNLCPSGSQGRIDNGQALAVISTVLTGVGIVAVGVGAALMIIANNHSDGAIESSPPIARLRLSPGPTPLSIGATASF